ncbi:hypothetical protein DPMN_079453 [Dreissena polymorpha]|uniref:Uncharacterized protein n=1 Tax=Dreissena polymorpha TaxID=45954 RepID=A0A9D3YUH7_DREPO|nr:hypothetical protein DPMN_079453 [Dreissena polymorpha]
MAILRGFLYSTKVLQYFNCTCFGKTLKYVMLSIFVTSLILCLKLATNFSDIYFLTQPFSSYKRCNINCSEERTSAGYFPKHVHQIFFNAEGRGMPKNFEEGLLTWQRDHNLKYAFTYTLWNLSMVENLISINYPWMKRTFNGYSQWVQKVDLAKYVILHKYGGLYADLDISSKSRDISELYGKVSKETNVILYETQPFGIGGDFFLSKPTDPYFCEVLCALPQADKWYVLPYVTTMMSTGPLYLTVRYRTFHDQRTIKVLSSDELAPFIRHTKGATWHQLDGTIMWWIFCHRKDVSSYLQQHALIFLSVVLFLVTLSMCLVFKRRIHLIMKRRCFSRI